MITHRCQEQTIVADVQALPETPERFMPVEAFEAQAMQHREETAKLRMLLVAYRMLLEQNGIEPPDDESADWLAMYRDCIKVKSVIQEAMGRLGTQKELLDDSWTK